MNPQERVQALNDERGKLIEAERKVLDDVKPGSPRTGEQVAELERINAAYLDIDSQIKGVVEREQREAEHAELLKSNEQLFGERQNAARDTRHVESFKDWLRKPQDQREDFHVNVQAAAKERDMLRQGATPQEVRNALLSDTGSIASAVPTSMDRSLYELLEATVAAMRMPTTKVNTSSGESMEFPTLASHGVATEISGQGTVIAGTDPAFDKLTLGAVRFGQLVRVANSALQDTVFDVGSFLGANIGRGLGRLVDAGLVLGSGGVSGGIINTGLGTVATGGTLTTLVGLSPNWVFDAVYGVNDAYRNGGSAGWLFKDASVGDIRKLRDGAGGTEGAYIWDHSRTSGLQDGQPDTFLGFPVWTDPNVAAIASNAIIGSFGDYSTYYMRQVGNVTVDSSAERFFDTDETGFRGRWRVDGNYADTTGVVIIRNRVS